MPTSISLLVQGDEKLKSKELAIISKLMNKRLEVELDDSDLKPDDSIVNYKRVETLILKTIKDAAPALRAARLKLDKVSSIKKTGWIEVAVSGATAKTFRVHLELVPPAKSDPTKRVGYKPDKDDEEGQAELAKKNVPKAPPLPPPPPPPFSRFYLAFAKKHQETPDPTLNAALLKLIKNKDAKKTPALIALANKLLVKDQAAVRTRIRAEPDMPKKMALVAYLRDFLKINKLIAKYQADLKKHAKKIGAKA